MILEPCGFSRAVPFTELFLLVSLSIIKNRPKTGVVVDAFSGRMRNGEITAGVASANERRSVKRPIR